ncbi:CCA tRNA nucleotidyltransferase [Dehalococcoidia bacterium]|nr:CCA tRNA nucleotidyltransferase [Dehalococcoidia bacterium]
MAQVKGFRGPRFTEAPEPCPGKFCSLTRITHVIIKGGEELLSNISQYLESYLPPGILGLLRDIGETTVGGGERVYLAGGVVRDLLLLGEPSAPPPVSTGGASLDLDLVVEGNAIALGRRIARVKNWGIRTHPRFGTAKLYQENLSLDLVTARSETYARPGALPAVKPGTIEDDLRRRDFTINAMAVCLSGDSFGNLLDPHGGQGDLGRGLIRILHRGSFSDDPTRILRALRYEKRLNFHLEQDTEGLMRRHLDSLDTVTGERLWHELELILKEECPEKVLCRADELGVLQRLHPALQGDSWLAERFVHARRIGEQSPPWHEVYLALLIYRLTGEEVEGCITRLKMPGWAARAGRDMVRLRQSLSSLASAGLRPSEIYRQLNRHLPQVIEAAAIASEVPIVRQRLDLYLKRLRHVKPELCGDDLRSMGVPPGRKMGRILRALQAAKLDQTVVTREDEEALVRAF